MWPRLSQSSTTTTFKNWTMCDVMREYGNSTIPLDGLFNFTQLSSTSVSFLAPCFINEGYHPISIELLDGRRTATSDHFKCGRVSEEDLFGTYLFSSSKCMQDEFLIGGRCATCPEGAVCLPGGRIWPIRGWYETYSRNYLSQKYLGHYCLEP